MKKIVSLTMMVFMAVIIFGQSTGLDQAISESLKLLDEAKTVEEVQSVVNRLERIALKEPEQWEPAYYYAFAQINLSFMEQKEDVKDKLLDKAEISINKALELKGDKSELHALQGFLYQAMLTADPSLAMTYSQKAAEVFGQALYENPENPRAIYLLGLNIRYTPEGFGGGCVNAMPHFLKAKALFEKENGKTGLLPRWGSQSNSEAIAGCNGEK
jgi:cytochrome c-type biogenesis protein CcmH/NrfG